MPVVAVGIFGDQVHNSLIPERNGWGRAFDRTDLLYSPDLFLGTVREVLADQK